MKIPFAAIFLALSIGASAQTVTDEPVKKPVAKKIETKKIEARKVEAKRPAPKKKEAVQKTPAPPSAPKVTVYKNSPNPPVLRDKDGNIIPTNPDAYDVSSAMGKKK